METNIDDMSGEIYSYLTEKLFKIGALDVFMTPIFMKKNRPANKLSVICKGEKKRMLEKIIFEESSTFGIRSYKVDRSELEREFEEVESDFGKISVKKGIYGGKVIKQTVEYEDAKRIALEGNIPLKEAYDYILERVKG